MEPSFTAFTAEVPEKLLEPFLYLLRIPGKNVRGKLIDAFQEWFKIPKEKLNIIKAIIKVDDIEDDSKLRRGVPVTHALFGIPWTMNTANYVYFMALEQCHQLRSETAMSVFVREMLYLHRGQGEDILWRETNRCPSPQEYIDMVLDKTGGLFRLAIGLMQAFSDNTLDFTPLVNKLAIYFQIRDDYVNLASPAYMKNKSFCEDLTEGKFSWPIIHCILSRPLDTRLMHILKQRTTDEELKKHALLCLHNTASLSHTRDVLVGLKEDVLVEIEKVGGHEGLAALVTALDKKLDAPSTTADSPPTADDEDVNKAVTDEMAAVARKGRVSSRRRSKSFVLSEED